MDLNNFKHPLLFVIFAGMAILGLQSLVTWGAKEAGLNGLAAIVQHP
jgi:hypothetical protein